MDDEPALRASAEAHLFQSIYGFSIIVVRGVKDSKRAIQLINKRGTIAVSKELTKEETTELFQLMDDTIKSFMFLNGKERRRAFDRWKGSLAENSRDIGIEYNKLKNLAERRRITQAKGRQQSSSGEEPSALGQGSRLIDKHGTTTLQVDSPAASTYLSDSSATDMLPSDRLSLS